VALPEDFAIFPAGAKMNSATDSSSLSVGASNLVFAGNLQRGQFFGWIQRSLVRGKLL
jgi:hypothetical protein